MSAEQQLFRLDTPEEWGPPRGPIFAAISQFFLDILHTRHCPIPCDDQGFPHCKPEFSVFYCGPQFRSRTERGWYQVTRWPRPVDSPKLHSSSLCTGADFPAELVWLVIDHIIPKRLWGEVQKHGLSTCALVCRQWAHLCRPAILHTLTLRNRNDLISLITFLQSPVSNLRDYFVNLLLVSKPADTPWMHLLPTSLYPLLAPGKLLPVCLEIEGPLHTSYPSLRSIHSTLPRSIPTFSARIASLTLRNLHFQKIDCLLHLIRELPDLTSFIGKQLTWPRTAPIQRDWLPQSRRPSVYVRLEGCTDYWVAVWLAEVEVTNDWDDWDVRWWGDRGAKHEDCLGPVTFRMRPNDRSRLATLVDTVVTSSDDVLSVVVDPGRPTFETLRKKREAWGRGCEVKGYGRWDALIEVTIRTVEGHQHEHASLLAYVRVAPGTTSGRMLRLERLEYFVKTPAIAKRLDWARFDETASAFPDLKVAVIDLSFDAVTHEPFAFSEYITRKLVRLRQASKVRIEDIRPRQDM